MGQTEHRRQSARAPPRGSSDERELADVPFTPQRANPTSSDLTFPAFGGIEGAMRRFPPGSASFASLLLAVIVGLPFLAYASPPDPSWVHGVYDDADFDDIVCLITTSSGLVADLSAACGSPHFILTDTELPRNERWIASSAPSSPQPRAPPSP